jgi:ferric-dicitrate binding protein FerR (iron transport regulator)
MNSFDKLKSLSKKTTWSLLKEEKPTDLETSDMFDENERKQLLFNITDASKNDEYAQFTNKLNKQQAWKNIMGSEKQYRTINMRPWLYAAAAFVVILFGITIFLNKGDHTPQVTEPIIVNNTIEVGSDKAILTLENGEQVTLEKGTQFQTQNATSNGEEITYLPAGRQGNKSTSRELVNNYLTIPRGGQYQITLSDGTKVWLNSETQLKYPVSFTDGESRQVELLYGEAYFDVSSSTEHNGATFKVRHKSQDVEVLGTEFNIKAYKDETNVYTTLVEGKVAIHYAGKNQILAPTEQSTLDIKTKNLSIATVNVNREISWKEGVFSFRNKSLKEIMKVLSRWYDMDVVFEDKELENVRFRGTFKKSFLIDNILIEIKSTGFINNYEINKKTIIIK